MNAIVESFVCLNDHSATDALWHPKILVPLKSSNLSRLFGHFLGNHGCRRSDQALEIRCCWLCVWLFISCFDLLRLFQFSVGKCHLYSHLQLYLGFFVLCVHSFGGFVDWSAFFCELLLLACSFVSFVVCLVLFFALCVWGFFVRILLGS